MQHATLVKKLRKLDACTSAMEWVESHPELSAAELWEQCERGDWMWWLLRQVALPTKAQSVAFAKWCAKRAKKNAAADAATYAASATDAAADAADAERKAQANYIRKHFACPL